MYMAVDSVRSLPVEFLKKVKSIGVAFDNDPTGEELSHAVTELLPHAKRIEPSGVSWNEILVEQRRIEQLEQKERRQQDRGFSR
jgi:5S rRNA maturation endonuclease (ribonuclease M5)